MTFPLWGLIPFDARRRGPFFMQILFPLLSSLAGGPPTGKPDEIFAVLKINEMVRFGGKPGG
jgi:hypothetical protein